MTSIESSYYENSDFWGGELFKDADLKRYDFVIEKIDPNVKSLVDIGCGNGLFLERVKVLRPDILTLHGVDRSAAALAHVQASTTKASADALPFDSQSFDCVTCLEVIEHLPNMVYQSALSEIARISNKQIIVSVPFEQDLTIGRVECPACRTLFNPDYHLRGYSQDSLMSLFRDEGYKMQSACAFGISKEYALVRQIDALKRNRENRFPVDVPCPVCGEVLPAKSGGVSAYSEAPNFHDRAQGKTNLRNMIKSFWPKVSVPRWLLADYIRQ